MVITKSIQACGRHNLNTSEKIKNVLVQIMTLTLRVGGWVMCMKHHLAMEKNCVKLYQIPGKYVEDTARTDMTRKPENI